MEVSLMKRSTKLKLILCLTAVTASFYTFSVLLQDYGDDLNRRELLPLNATGKCLAKFGNFILDDLQKIDSLKFPLATPYLRSLLPYNFSFSKVRQSVRQSSYFDQSLPSIPALVTAFSTNHYSEAMELIENINKVVRPAYKHIKFYIFDLGLTLKQRQKVERACSCEVTEFPFHNFPEHIRNLHNYCWKPLAIQMVLRMHRFVMWMDASVRFMVKDLDQNFKDAQKLGVQASLGFAPIAARTSGKTFQFLKEYPCLFRDKNEFEATFIIIYGSDFIMQYFMAPWVSCALTEECMAPEPLRDCHNQHVYFDCHRFDQSVLSILLVRLFHGDNKAHTMDHTFFKICKNGIENPMFPSVLNAYLNMLSQKCY